VLIAKTNIVFWWQLSYFIMNVLYFVNFFCDNVSSDFCYDHECCEVYNYILCIYLCKDSISRHSGAGTIDVFFQLLMSLFPFIIVFQFMLL